MADFPTLTPTLSRPGGRGGFPPLLAVPVLLAGFPAEAGEGGVPSPRFRGDATPVPAMPLLSPAFAETLHPFPRRTCSPPLSRRRNTRSRDAPALPRFRGDATPVHAMHPLAPLSRGEGWGEGHTTDAEFPPVQHRFVSARHHSKTGLSEILSIQDKLFSRHRAQSARHAARHPVPLSTYVQGRPNQRCTVESDAVAET